MPGLRREEVAVLAGVSIQYYTRLERGDMSGVSDSVLEGLARALQLDDAERAHLLDLARAAHPMPPRPRRRLAKQGVRPDVQWTLDAITGAAAFVGNDRLDMLAANQLGRALYSQLYDTPVRPVNTARFVFLDPRAEAAFPEWDRVASETVAILRSAAGRDPYNRELTDLVGELATQSEAFRARWATHNVRFHTTGTKRFVHPVVGELSLSYNLLALGADPGLTLATYTAEPGSRSEDALRLLGSWAATIDPPSPHPPPTDVRSGSMSRIVVIGATGHVGTYLVPRLVRAGHEVVAVSRGTREPYLPGPEWRDVERVVSDREAEDAAGVFGNRIAALVPDAVIDMLCFTPDSARQLVDALRPTRPLLVRCGSIWVHGPASGSPSPKTNPAPPTANTEPTRRPSRRCCTAKPSPEGSRQSCCTPATSPDRGPRSHPPATSTQTSGGSWLPANRSPCLTSGSVCCTTYTPTMSHRPLNALSPGQPRLDQAFTWSPNRQ